MTLSRTHRGYTLLELIVSVGIFSVVMLAASAAYLSLINLDRNARATTDVVTNLSFVIDSMTREMRAGDDYRCNQSPTVFNCSGGGDSFSFVDADGRTIAYTVSGGQVFMSVNGVSAGALTDPRVQVSMLKFYVRGVGTTAANVQYVQPQVLLIMRGTMPSGQGKTVSFSLQGSVTQRFLELPS